MQKYSVCDNIDLPTILQVCQGKRSGEKGGSNNLSLSIITTINTHKLCNTHTHTHTHTRAHTQEYESYYFVKFKKTPKITKRATSSGKPYSSNSIPLYIAPFLVSRSCYSLFHLLSAVAERPSCRAKPKQTIRRYLTYNWLFMSTIFMRICE